MGARPRDDDPATVDLGPRALIDATEGAASGTSTALHLGAPGGAADASRDGDFTDDDAADPAALDDDLAGDAPFGDPAAVGAGPAAVRAGLASPIARLASPIARLASPPAAAPAALGPGSAAFGAGPAEPLADAPHDPIHALPTQQLPPRRKTGASPSQQSASRAATHATADSPIDAMRLDEMQRMRVFLKVVLGICLGGILVALLSQGDPIARNVVLIGTGLAIAGTLWMLIAVRGRTTFDARTLIAPCLLVVVGSMSGVYYWGAASPVAAMLVYGIYFFSLGSNVRVTAALCALVAVIHGALGLGIVTGLVTDRGVVNMTGLRTLDQLTLLSIIECLYAVAFLTARASQRFTLDAMTKLQQAARHVAQRDALLAEARAELDRALKIGGPGRFSDQVIGSFRLGVLLGRGGMGEVYEAQRVADRSEAAVKLLHPGTLGDPTAVQRFLREARTAARFDSPHVVRVLEVGTTTGEIPFIAMERLRGTDLARQLRRHRKLGLAPARVIAEHVAAGLEAARAAGIVHRDLKPHNIFYAEAADGGGRRWKILDFGVSKSGGSGTLTRGHVVGTPAYMAPEQARGEDVDHRADVYSLAAILYRAITGHPAFSGKDVPTTLYEVVYRIPTQPSLLAHLPADVDRVLALGLAKRPEDRLATAIELALLFAAAIHDALDPAQRRRADELIARYPWGTRLGSASSAPSSTPSSTPSFAPARDRE